MKIYIPGDSKTRKNYLTPSDIFNLVYTYHNKAVPLLDLYDLSNMYFKEYKSYSGFYKKQVKLSKLGYITLKNKNHNQQRINNSFSIISLSYNGFAFLQSLGFVSIDMSYSDYLKSTATNTNKHFIELQKSVVETDMLLTEMKVPFSLLSGFINLESLFTLNGFGLVESTKDYSFNMMHPKAEQLDYVQNPLEDIPFFNQSINRINDYVSTLPYGNGHFCSIRGYSLDEVLTINGQSISDYSLTPDHLYSIMRTGGDFSLSSLLMYEIDNYTETLDVLEDKLKRYIYYAEHNPDITFTVFFIFGRKYNSEGLLILDQLDRAYNLMVRLFNLDFTRETSLPHNLNIVLNHINYLNPTLEYYIKTVQTLNKFDGFSVLNHVEYEELYDQFLDSSVYEMDGKTYDKSDDVQDVFERQYAVSFQSFSMIVEQEENAKGYILIDIFNPNDHFSILDINFNQVKLYQENAVADRMKHYILFKNKEEFEMYRMMYMNKQIVFQRTYFILLEEEIMFFYNLNVNRSNRLRKIK